MRRFSWLISKYVLQAVLPYFIATWLLLSVILFIQQAGGYSNLLFSTTVPNYLVWQLTLALVPSVIAFTGPVAALVGVIIGLSRMQGDSELVVLRATGVGNVQIILPIAILGLLLSLFAFLINIIGVPFAAQIVRRVAIQAAIAKLESPVEPGTFNRDVNGFTIYVREGNRAKGTWEKIFIFQEDEVSGSRRLITANEGRIDTAGEDSEIVLEGAQVTTIQSASDNEQVIATENVKELRLVVQTKRAELIQKLSETKRAPEEMGLTELARYSNSLSGKERTDAQILWQRRIMLSITPLLFALLGVSLVSRFNRGGRGFGILLALLSLIIYYLVALFAEQLARTGVISVTLAGLAPILLASVTITWLLLSRRFLIGRSFFLLRNLVGKRVDGKREVGRLARKNAYIDLTTGILDLDLIWSLIKNYLLTLAFLASIFLIFTTFEHWKFAGTKEDGFQLLFSYLFYLLPFMYIQLAPSALMVSTLATYIIKSRQNEIVTWTAAGQSIYRLLLPCFLLMIIVGIVNLGIQEWLLTPANRKQDALRGQLRSRDTKVRDKGLTWIASDNRIVSFRRSASDNETRPVSKLTLVEIDPSNFKATHITFADKGQSRGDKLILSGNISRFSINGREAQVRKPTQLTVETDTSPLNDSINKPSHLSISDTSERVNESESATESTNYAIALHQKYSTPFLPLIITMFTAPFALSLSRRGNILTLAYAVGIWLLFMGVTNAFNQLGMSMYLPPAFAVWSPLVIFATLGLYLMTKIRT